MVSVLHNPPAWVQSHGVSFVKHSMYQIGHIVQWVHQQGYVLRDFKIDQLLKGSGWHWKLSDLGGAVKVASITPSILGNGRNAENFGTARPAARTSKTDLVDRFPGA